MQSAVTPEVACTAMTDAFHAQLPLCLGPVRHRVEGAQRSVRRRAGGVGGRRRGARAAGGRCGPTTCCPSGALLGDEDARNELVNEVYRSLRGDNADDPTLTTGLDLPEIRQFAGDATAKELNVHPNTVRYRLKRAAETTGWGRHRPDPPRATYCRPPSRWA